MWSHRFTICLSNCSWYFVEYIAFSKFLPMETNTSQCKDYLTCNLTSDTIRDYMWYNTISEWTKLHHQWIKCSLDCAIFLPEGKFCVGTCFSRQPWSPYSSLLPDLFVCYDSSWIRRHHFTTCLSNCSWLWLKPLWKWRDLVSYVLQKSFASVAVLAPFWPVYADVAP